MKAEASARRWRRVALALLLLGVAGWVALGEPVHAPPAAAPAAIPDVVYAPAPDAPAAPTPQAAPDPGPTFLLTVTDEAGAVLREATAAEAPREGDALRLPQAIATCVPVEAPGFLDADLCPPRGGFDGQPRTLALERANVVQLRCDEGAGPGPCPTRLLARCLSPDTPDFGRCDPPTCSCPDDPGARVIAMGRGWSGAEAAVENGTATLRHEGTGALVFPGDWRGETTILVGRELGERSALVGRATVRPDGSARLDGLPAGTYAATLVGEGYLRVRHLPLAEGETRTVDLTAPPGRLVEVEGHPEAVYVEGGDRRWQRYLGGEDLDVHVPAGARLTVFTLSGCCLWTDPPDRVRCDAPTTDACPDRWIEDAF